jgi:MFS transporter, DHA2 family, multidrug resistance protein
MGAQLSKTQSVERVDWRMVAVAGAMSFVAMADCSVATVVIPSVVTAFNTSAAVAALVLLGYQIPVAALLPFFGSLFASISMRMAVPITIAGFTVAGALCTAAGSMPWLIAARVAQGAFASALLVQMPLLAAAVPRAYLGRAMSVPAISGPLGAAVGAGLGGVIVAQFGYRSVFLLHIPVCILALVLFAAAFQSRPEHDRPPARQFHWRQEVTGAAVSAAGITLLLFAIGGFQRGLGALVTAVVGVVLVLTWLRIWGRGPRQVVQRTATGPIHLAIALLALGFVVLTYTVSVTLQDAAGHSGAAGTGAALMAFPLAMTAAGIAGGRLADRFSAKAVACLGAGTVGVAALLFLTMPPVWTPVAAGWRLAIAGAGMGLYGGPTQALVFSRAGAADQRAILSGSTQLARNVGFAIGPACAIGVVSFGAPVAPVVLATAAAVAGTIALVASIAPSGGTAGADSETVSTQPATSQTSSTATEMS